MAFVSTLFRDNSPQQANIQTPATTAQATQLYGQTQDGIQQQQAFANAVAQQNGLQNQNQVYQQLSGIANGTGPSVAQNQLAQSTQTNVANQAALMAGQRGSSQNAGLIARQSALQGANAQQQAAGQAATLRSSEQLGAIGQMGSLATNQVGQQQGALSNLNQFTQGAQANTLNAINGQNSSAVSSQGSVNAANSAITGAQFGMLGQGLGAAGAGLVKKAAHGGMIEPDHVTRLREHYSNMHSAPKMADGGEVPGQAQMSGDNLKNDTVPTMLSPGEIVIPRTILQSKDPGEAAKQFVLQALAGKGPKPKEVEAKQAFADGGEVNQTSAVPDYTSDGQVSQLEAQAPQDWFSKVERGAAAIAEPFIAPIAFGSGNAGHAAYQAAVLKNQIGNQAPSSAPADPQPTMSPVGSPDVPMTASMPSAQQPPQQQPTDPYGYGAMTGAMASGINSQMAGINMQGSAEAKAADAKSAAASQQVDDAQSMNQTYQTEYKKLESQRAEFQSQLASGKIDPNHYINSQSGGERVETAIGLILGGLGAGIAGLKSNPAMDFMNQQIDRDIASQKDNLGKTESLLKMNLQQFGNLHDATTATRAMMSDVYSAKLEQAAASAGSEAAKGRALQASGQLQAQSAPLMQQLAMKKAMMSGMQSGQVDPSMVIRAIVPEHEQAAAYKELTEAQNTVKTRDNILSAWQQVHSMNTLKNGVTSPLQTGRSVDAIVEPLIAQLSKDSAGKFTEADAGALRTMFTNKGDNDAVDKLKFQKLNSFVSAKMNFPMLKAYGINPTSQSRFGTNGQSAIQETKIGGK